MAAVRAVLICAAGALMATLLGGQRPAMRLCVVIAAGLCVAAFCLDDLRAGVETLSGLCGQAGLSGDHTNALIRATGVAVLVEFGAQLCRDAGEGALAVRVELAGRVTLLGIALPILAELMERLSGLQI